ncbi:MAG: pentapeptide repeat-containing protein, partial [Acidimicrobiales bacterium]|nr:pentapeptide repeat-containing protein [Acidimicrobiales bacterium]
VGATFNGGTGFNLTNADLTSADFNSTFYSNVNLTGATMTDADIDFATFSSPVGTTGAQLDATNHNWLGTRIINGDLSGIDFVAGSYALGSSTSFQNSNLSNTTFAGGVFGTVTASGANFTNADLTGAAFTSLSVSGANLTDATFTGATGTFSGGATATYSNTTCPDTVIAPAGAPTCVGHGFA